MTQKISKKFRVSAGFGLEASRFRESGEDVTSYLIDGIGRAVYDSRNSLFDPELGYLLEAELMPTYNFGDEAGYFTTATLDGSTYRRISDKFVVAGRMKIGSIIGSDFDSIALNRRFFAGGGGSVRGFEYQTISPVDGDGELIGGRSISEVGAELRYKGDSPIGFAAFVDAGSVTEKEFPDFSDIRAGAGIGVRYYTSFAPLRVDIATPINKRPGDSAIQLYISIGQSF
jgi:translocation and assembly module TamA